MDSLDQFYSISFYSWTWTQTGFIFQLSSCWTRYIFIYYLPSALCVITSWASFLSTHRYIIGYWILFVILKQSQLLLMLIPSTGCSWPNVSPSDSLPLLDYSLSLHHHLQPSCCCLYHCPHYLDHYPICLHHSCYHGICCSSRLFQVLRW